MSFDVQSSLIFSTALLSVNLFALLVMGIYALRHYAYTLLFIAMKLGSKKKQNNHVENLSYFPRVSILVPAHNEENVIADLLSSLVSQEYPRDKMEIIVINDGSTDRTGEIARGFANSYPGLVKVVEVAEGGKGKANALNIGLDHATGDVILVFDADYIATTDSVAKLVYYLTAGGYQLIQGQVIPYNTQKLFSKVVALERTVGYLCEFPVRDRYGLFIQYAGTVGGFKRDVINTLGKWDKSSLAEDTDLTCRATLKGYRIKYEQDIIGFEQAVEDMWAYFKQRFRWAKGHTICCLRYFKALAKAKNISLRKKIDGLLVLFMYLSPISWLLTSIFILATVILNPLLSPIILSIPFIGDLFWVSVAFWLFIFSALFVESLVSVALSGVGLRRHIVPLMLIPIVGHGMAMTCVLALVDLALDRVFRAGEHTWERTEKKRGITFEIDGVVFRG